MLKFSVAIGWACGLTLACSGTTDSEGEPEGSAGSNLGGSSGMTTGPPTNACSIADFPATGANTQAQIESLRGCAEIAEDRLTIRGFAGLDLEPLSDLRQLDTLILDQFGQVDLSPLAGLQSVQRFRLTGSPGLTALSGLGSLSVAAEIYITDNAALTSLDGLALPQSLSSVGIFGNPQLRNIDALSSLTSTVYMELSGSSIPDLSALANLTSVSFELSLFDMPVSDLTVLSNLTVVGGLSLTNLPSVVSLAGLEAPTGVGPLALVGLGITDVQPLVGLRTAGEVNIANNPELVDLTALSGMATMAGLVVQDNPKLEQLPLLAQITSMTQLKVIGNPELLDAPQAATLQEVEAELFLMNNAKLQSVTGFPALATVDVLRISGNELLEEVTLDSLTSVFSLDLSCNALLDVTSLTALIERAGPPFVAIDGNLGSEETCQPKPL